MSVQPCGSVPGHPGEEGPAHLCQVPPDGDSGVHLLSCRIYLNWWSSEAASQPMRARVPGLTPSHQVAKHSLSQRASHDSGMAAGSHSVVQGELSLEMIELEVKQPVTGISVCPATGPHCSQLYFTVWFCIVLKMNFALLECMMYFCVQGTWFW